MCGCVTLDLTLRMKGENKEGYNCFIGFWKLLS